MNLPTVAIVGNGASAMYAFLACRELGIVPTVYEFKRSIQAGAFWLKFLPIRYDNLFKVHTIRIASSGTRDVYIRKQWAFTPKDYTSSFPEEPIFEQGYDPKQVLSYFSTSQYKNVETLTSPLNDEDLKDLSKKYNLVFHSFPSEENKRIFAGYLVRAEVVSFPDEEIVTDVIYDGLLASATVRKSRLFGTVYYELGQRITSEKIKDFMLETIPNAVVSSYVDLHPNVDPDNLHRLGDRIFPIGRMATMNRSDLSHSAFSRVIEAIQDVL